MRQKHTPRTYIARNPDTGLWQAGGPFGPLCAETADRFTVERLAWQEFDRISMNGPVEMLFNAHDEPNQEWKLVTRTAR